MATTMEREDLVDKLTKEFNDYILKNQDVLNNVKSLVTFIEELDRERIGYLERIMGMGNQIDLDARHPLYKNTIVPFMNNMLHLMEKACCPQHLVFFLSIAMLQERLKRKPAGEFLQ